MQRNGINQSGNLHCGYAELDGDYLVVQPFPVTQSHLTSTHATLYASFLQMRYLWIKKHGLEIAGFCLISHDVARDLRYGNVHV